MDDADKIYGEEDPDFSGTVTGLVNSNDLGTISYIRTNDDEDVGEYPGVLDATYTANDNYAVTVTKGDFEITAKTIQIEIEGQNKTRPYNGQTQEQLQYEVKGIDDLDIELSEIVYSGGKAEGKDVGVY